MVSVATASAKPLWHVCSRGKLRQARQESNLHPPREFGVETVAQAVAQHVDGEDHQRERGAGEQAG
jgi:hypothetical protein